MEEYWQLNWSRRQKRSQAELETIYAQNAAKCPGSETDVWNMHLNEIDPRTVATSNRELPDIALPFIDPRTNRVAEHAEIDWTGDKEKKQTQPNLFKRFPVHSSLTRSQHMAGLKALRAQGTKILTETEQLAILEYSDLKGKIEQDHIKFTAFLDQSGNEKLQEKLQSPQRDLIEVGKLATRYESSKYEDKLYAVQTGIPLDSEDGEYYIGTRLSVEEELVAMGVVKNIRLKSATPMAETLSKSCYAGTSILKKDEKTTRKYSTYIGTQGRKSGGIFISSDAIYQIISAELNCSWTIPFLIQNSDNNQQYVYFENPFLKPQGLSELELERIGLVLCYHATLLSGSSARSYSFDEEKFIGRIIESQVGCEQNTSQNENKTDNDDDDVDEDDDGSKLVIDSPEGDQNVEVEEPQDPSDSSKKRTNEYKLVEFNEYLAKYVNSEQNEPVNYLLNKITLKSQEANSVPIPLFVTSQSAGLSKKKNAALSIKFEYKSEFGAQRMARDELLREWCTIAFSTRIDHVVRIRVDYQTSIVMSVDYLDQEEIETEMDRLHGLKPDRVLGRLYNVLSLINRLQTGQYLLDKEQRHQQILVYMATEGGPHGKLWTDLMMSGSINNGLNSRPSNIEQPIDFDIVTQLHRQNCVLPGCIPADPKLHVQMQIQQRKQNKNIVKRTMTMRGNRTAPQKTMATKKKKKKKKKGKGKAIKNQSPESARSGENGH